MRVLRARLYEASWRTPAGRAVGDAERAGRLRRARREDPHLQLPAEPRHRPPGQASAHRLEDVLAGELDEFTEALDRRRAAPRPREAPDDARRGAPRDAAESSRRKGVDTPRLDAELLLAHALGLSRLELYTQHDRPLTEAERAAARALVERRGAARAARLRARRVGLPPADAEDRRARARAAARDGDRGRARARAAARASRRRACSTSAPAPARSRSRSPTSGRTRASSRPTSRRHALELARENADAPRARGRARRGRASLDGRGGPVRPRRLEPAVRPAAELDGAAAGGARLGAAPRDRRRRADRRARRRGCARCSHGRLVVLEVHEHRAGRGRGRCCAALGTPDVTITRDLAGRERVVEARWERVERRGAARDRGDPRGQAGRPPDRQRLRALRDAVPVEAPVERLYRLKGRDARRSRPRSSPPSVDMLFECVPELRGRAGTIVARAPARALHARAREPGAALPLAERTRARRRSASASPSCRRLAAGARRGRRGRRHERERPGRPRPRASTRCPSGSARRARPSVDAGELPGDAVDRDRLHRRRAGVLREGAAPSAEAIARVRDALAAAGAALTRPGRCGSTKLGGRCEHPPMAGAHGKERSDGRRAGDPSSSFGRAGLAEVDPEIADALGRELERQRGQIELIASENFTWPSVLEAVGSTPTNKYAEGYPGQALLRRLRGRGRDRGAGASTARRRSSAPSTRTCSRTRARRRTWPSTSPCSAAGRHAPRALASTTAATSRTGSRSTSPGGSTTFPHYGVSRETMHGRLRRGARPGEGGAAEADRLRRLRVPAHRRGRPLPRDRRRGRGAAHAATWRTSPASSPPACTRTRSRTATSSPRPRTRRSPARAPASSSAARSTRRRSTAPSSRACRAARSSTRSRRRRRASGSRRRDAFRAYQEQVRRNADVLAATLVRRAASTCSPAAPTRICCSSTCARPSGRALAAEERLEECRLTVNRNTVPFDERPPMVASGVRIGTPAMTMRGFDEDDFREVGRDHRRRARRRRRPRRRSPARAGALCDAAPALPGLPRLHDLRP